MSYHDLYCSCRNIHINGRLLSENQKLHISGFELDKLKSVENDIFEFCCKQFSIQQPDKVSSKNYSESCMKITCLSCRNSFIVCTSQFIGYASRKETSQIHGEPLKNDTKSHSTQSNDTQSHNTQIISNNTTRTLTVYFPPKLRPFVCIEKNEDETNEYDMNDSDYHNNQNDFNNQENNSNNNNINTSLGDPDFDLMFAGTKDAIVGSFTQEWVDDNDNLFK
ncbi:hypothetical protein TRFO_01330 [Tritrichomonas foetus]|uniref:Uncharacterized protein n=1 Tax=Tritrichomonas foetus TaxID=1144522 RepID=A0A1J4K8I4_9EUKA|nr:hypothetical protein TRFO_01330 [Tritrichomonas foetus]|eukprot:OHT07192.1 hypothetical protein TRFO_01330 [Tritrichomonas foetus]